ncbi:MAG: hypothetical protein ABW221_26395 [Vicinamibacteria bacterium]
MTELSRYLFLAGALPFVVLGLLHARATPLSTADRKGLSPADPDLAEAMARAPVLLTKRVDVWQGWVGFNLSHSLGAVAFGAFVLAAGRSAESFAAQAAVCGPLAVAVSGAFLAIGLRYWFKIPIAGCAVAFACFALSWVLRLLSA